jgi:acyl-CoA synthetase (NDP forming)
MCTEVKELTTHMKLLFEPSSVAVIGASNDRSKWGYRVLSNIMRGGFEGRIYPVNPGSPEVLGLKAYARVTDIPEVPDLAVIVVPPPGVPEVMRDCAAKGVKAAVVITAGFAEIGGEGERLQREIVEIARGAGIRFVGPNCLGILNPSHKLHPQMPAEFARPGPLAVISQSGNIMNNISRLVDNRGYGLSKGVSIGNQADLRAEDYLEYFARDPQTRVILSYIEGFKDGARFFRIARAVSKEKPIVLLKAGETPAGARAAHSHTASLAVPDAIIEAMCRQAGIIRVTSLDDLVDTGITFLGQPLPRGRRVAIITGGGGWGVLTADACAKLGLDVVILPPETIEELDKLMPAWWNRGNPVDFVGGGPREHNIDVVEILLRCPVVDGVILLGLMPPVRRDQMASIFDPAQGGQEMKEFIASMLASVLDTLKELSERYQKPIVLASPQLDFGALPAQETVRILAEHDAICFELPDQAAAAFARLVQYSEYRNQE